MRERCFYRLHAHKLWPTRTGNNSSSNNRSQQCQAIIKCELPLATCCQIVDVTFCLCPRSTLSLLLLQQCGNYFDIFCCVFSPPSDVDDDNESMDVHRDDVDDNVDFVADFYCCLPAWQMAGNCVQHLCRVIKLPERKGKVQQKS